MNPVRCFWFVSRNLNKERRVITSLSAVLMSLGDARRSTRKLNISTFHLIFDEEMPFEMILFGKGYCLLCKCSLVSNIWSDRPCFFHFLEDFLHQKLNMWSFSVFLHAYPIDIITALTTVWHQSVIWWRNNPSVFRFLDLCYSMRRLGSYSFKPLEGSRRSNTYLALISGNLFLQLTLLCLEWLSVLSYRLFAIIFINIKLIFN